MPGEPGRLDDLPGEARVPLSATYWDDKHRDANGVQQGVSTWAAVPLPADRPPATLEDVAARARLDVQRMSVSGAGGLLGVAANLKPAPRRYVLSLAFCPRFPMPNSPLRCQGTR